MSPSAKDTDGKPEQGVSVHRDGPVTVITIDRIHARNALDLPATKALVAAFRQFEADDEAKVAVLTGAGGAFCAGADLKEMATDGAVYEPWAGSPEGPTNAPLTKPIIAAVEGHAVAGGLGLAVWCDLRVAAESAIFGVFCRRFGVPMSDGTTVRLPRLIGLGRAIDMLTTGRAVDANEAKSIGLADRIAPHGQALVQAIELAKQIASFPELAMLADRASAYAQAGLVDSDAIRQEAAFAQQAKERTAQHGAADFANGAGRGGEFSNR
ncbi:MAG: enoyl-CoA hydratase [Acidimicrobiales bacterium]|jgi:enoyl-CoA hydratase